jgi:hypothetical protein
LFIRELTVRKHERSFLLRNGDFQRFLVTMNKERLRVQSSASARLRAAQLAVTHVRLPWIFSTRRTPSRVTL